MVFTGTVEKTHDRCLSMSLSLGSMGKNIRFSRESGRGLGIGHNRKVKQHEPQQGLSRVVKYPNKGLREIGKRKGK
jgi:hypothetical protein